MSKIYNALDWYWLADDGRVFGSKAGAVVDKTDLGFVAFVEDGTSATRWPSDDTGAQTNAALNAVLAPYGLSTAGSVRSALGTTVSVTGDQWALAINDLGLASAWMAGIAKSKASDQFRIGLIARDTMLVATDPLLIRVAGNCTGVALATVFAHAQTMPSA